MGIETLQVSLSTPPYHIFRPGDMVTGTVRLVTSQDTDLTEGNPVINMDKYSSV